MTGRKFRCADGIVERLLKGGESVVVVLRNGFAEGEGRLLLNAKLWVAFMNRDGDARWKVRQNLAGVAARPCDFEGFDR